ncbi:COX15/CtaA family protein [Novosphingobium sp. TH158]|uniref:COX15/CtaA family protein n=1 Tax=Novosphingobium sp. TH158 TaxID=2067455 RepID=UPI000C7CFD63|nr:COX15/CtaA family protein [Novosphingobium sp. TH158]PLK27244.1 heme A synthase [Novosphingobium sp. TH158]
MNSAHTPARGIRPLILARWLWLVAAIIVCVVAVGGITRLTESGLSITEWKPVTGVLPPLSEQQWHAEFEAYKQIPQYTQVNGPAGMTLEEYKFIYFWEWFHRFLVRTGLGLAFVVPLAWFWLRGSIPAGFKPRLLGLLGLGLLQAVVGWWMVKSGLSGDADVKVSHFRLATHLLLALFTLTYTTWTALDMHALARGEKPARLTGFGIFALAALFLQLFLGALVAGLRAGHVANDWPLMMGRFWPDGIDWSQGVIHAVLNDPFLVHFLHRWWAWGVVAILVILARRIRKSLRPASIAIHSAFGLQIILGIATVMTGVELWLAVLHQTVGALVVMATAWGAHGLGRQR